MSIERILIISVSGIGNTILQSPLIETILADPKYRVDILFGNKAMAHVFQDHPFIAKSYIMPDGLLGITRLFLSLIRNRYYSTVSCFPSNRHQFHLLPFLIGAKKRIIHLYPEKNLVTSVLSNSKIPAIKGIHDVEQNLNLLKGLEIKSDVSNRMLTFRINSHEAELAEEFLAQKGLGRDKTFFGIHAGSGPIKGKKWGTERFSEAAKKIMVKADIDNVLIFGGPEEQYEKKELAGMIGEKAVVVEGPTLGFSGAVIKKCCFFLSNDSGLMHIAAALGIKVLGIFGPTDWTRTAPYGPNAHFIHPELPCSPCLTYPFSDFRPKLNCKDTFPCLKAITVDSVVEKAINIIKQ